LKTKIVAVFLHKIANMTQVTVFPPNKKIEASIALASSKSESNRALIINALTGFKSQIDNLSSARDTQTMMRLLQSDEPTADVLDAGTTMRFLTAYFAITNQNKILTGTPRMCERPIKILSEALKTLGADITYLKEEGYPPIQINGFDYAGTDKVQLRGDVSSQYISALLMIAPLLPNGLTIELTTAIGSRPYIEMTLQQMAHFGINYTADWANKRLYVGHQSYQANQYQVESDWSGASYWYSMVALADEAEIELLGLKSKSLQGDSAIVEIMQQMGVHSAFNERGVVLTKIEPLPSFEYDFSNCPDLVQTVAVCAAIKGIEVTMTGIESLKIKETDRVAALQAELPKIGGNLVEIEANHKYKVNKTSTPQTAQTDFIKTYDDHRMAMAFAPVGMCWPITIAEPGVVAKSYPSFWDDVKLITKVEM
jgi:3-phosphoshikimate 1-carboxyvinyltransferase